MPRRRAPMMWVPTTHGEEESTRIDDHPPWDVVAASPSMNPSRASIPSLVSSRPSPVPMRPLPMPPPVMPTHSMQMQAQPMPMHMHMPVAPSPVSPGHFYSYAETCARQLDATAPVAPLPFAELATNSFPRQVSRWSRIAMPIGGAIAFAIFVTAYIASRDTRPELPAITSVSRAEVPAIVAAAAPAPAEIPADSHWKPRTVVPTMDAADAPREAVAAAHEEVPAAEIEMAPAVAAQPRKRIAAPVAAPPPKKSNARVAVKAPREDADPILAEIVKPAREAQAKATGPGKAVVSSDTPSLVYIDGRATSLKTPTTINLAPGAHKITLVAVATRKAKTVDVEIKSGTSVPVHREFGTSPASSSSSSKSKPSAAKSRRVKFDTSSALGSLRPGKAW